MRKPVGGAVTPHGHWHDARTRADGTPRLHKGIYLAAPRGAVVVSPIDGVVVASTATSAPPWTGYAPVVAVWDGRDTMHVLSHLERLDVAKGQRVKEGQVVGTVGRLRHVHWEIRRRGVAVNPANIGPGVAVLAWVGLAIVAGAVAGAAVAGKRSRA